MNINRKKNDSDDDKIYKKTTESYDDGGIYIYKLYIIKRTNESVDEIINIYKKMKDIRIDKNINKYTNDSHDDKNINKNTNNSDGNDYVDIKWKTNESDDVDDINISKKPIAPMKMI